MESLSYRELIFSSLRGSSLVKVKSNTTLQSASDSNAGKDISCEVDEHKEEVADAEYFIPD